MKEMDSRVREIHEDIIIVDAHLDLSYDLYNKHLVGQKNVIAKDYLEDFKKGKVNVIIATIFVDSRDVPESALKHGLGQVGALYTELEEMTETMALCTTYDELEKTIEAGKIAILLSFEGVEPLGDNLELLNIFYKLGVRGLGICWSRRNHAADGGLYTEVEQGKKSGLTNFGYQLVRAAEGLGMFIDISHLNDEGVEDVMKITKMPIIASHSNCRAINPTKRNLCDEQIIALAERDGVIGMNSCTSIVTNSIEKATVKTLADHIDHIAKLVGIEHVGLGFDFCEKILPSDAFIEINGNRVPTRDVIAGYGGISALTEELIQRNYTKEDIKGIYGGNFMRVFKTILK